MKVLGLVACMIMVVSVTFFAFNKGSETGYKKGFWEGQKYQAQDVQFLNCEAYNNAS